MTGVDKDQDQACVTFVIFNLFRKSDLVVAFMKTGILIAALLILCFGDKTLAERPVCFCNPTPFFCNDISHAVIRNGIPDSKQLIVKELTVSYNKQQLLTDRGEHKHRKLRQRLQRISACAAEPASAMPVVFSQALVPFTDKHETLLKSAGFPPFQPPRPLS